MPGQTPLDDLIREILLAPDDATRAAASARLSAIPDVLGQLGVRLQSDDWAQRGPALQLVTQISPPPLQLASGVMHCLRNPLGDDPLGDEMALVLVACGLYAFQISGFRETLLKRVRAVDHAEELAEPRRGPVMRRLAHETLDKVDAAIAESERRYNEEIKELLELLRAGKRDEADAWVHFHCDDDDYYPELARAGRWESAGNKLRASDAELARFCYSEALRNYQEHAAGSTSGGEGLARMLDVHRLVKVLGTV